MKTERVVGRVKGMDRFILLIKISCVFTLLFFNSVSAADNVDREKLSKWAGAICSDLGSMSISTQYYGVNMTAIGMVQDPSILKGYGFTFGEGPYRTSITRIDTGRYRVRIQAMSRPNDNAWKQIRLETKADRIYPVAIPAAPAGKYFWNAAIQFDMEDQLGIIPHYEMDSEPVGFVDLRIIDPDKFAAAGFPGYKKNDTASQMIYRGSGKWEFNPGGVRPGRGMLMYTDGQWSSSGAAAAASKPVETAAAREEKETSTEAPPENTGVFAADSLVLVKVAAGDMTYNEKPYEWVVYEGRINDRVYYLVTSPDLGQALIDISGNAMFDAETATALPGGGRDVTGYGRSAPD